jgi:hypothetical protein
MEMVKSAAKGSPLELPVPAPLSFSEHDANTATAAMIDNANLFILKIFNGY